jgi:hypothetical protein
MPRDKSDVEAALVTKGFRKDNGDHRYFIYWSEAGKKAMAKTMTSHGSGRELSDDLIAKMARQIGLTKPNFTRLIECPLQRPEYEVILKQAGKL